MILLSSYFLYIIKQLMSKLIPPELISIIHQYITTSTLIDSLQEEYRKSKYLKNKSRSEIIKEYELLQKFNTEEDISDTSKLIGFINLTDILITACLQFQL